MYEIYDPETKGIVAIAHNRAELLESIDRVLIVEREKARKRFLVKFRSLDNTITDCGNIKEVFNNGKI